jgi:fido (protein-threonine AMPylation protein)
MEFKIDAAEREATEDLIRDFGTRKDLSVEEVYKTSWNRFNIIEGSQHKVRLLHQLVHDDEYKYNYENLPAALHFYMYEGLFTFAGHFRNINDLHNGRVYFGKQHAQQLRPKFEGHPPDKIEAGVSEATQYLLKHHQKAPVLAAVRFYQKFVNVHPFYDGNGRIARLIANIFLTGYQITISWSEFDSKSGFLKKLNRCHLNPTEETFKLLANFIRRHSIKFKDLEN